MTFDQWMSKVDDYIWAVVGCSVYDLPDCPFRDWFGGGMTPKKAAAKALKGAGW